MRDRMERLVVLPFSLGCISHASISVVEPPSRGSPASNTKSSSRSREGLEEESVYQERTKNSSKILIQPKFNISTGVNKLVKSFRSLSQLFGKSVFLTIGTHFVCVAYEDELEDLEIGCPTDVKHVTHIGWDGSSYNINNPIAGWDNLIAPDLLFQPHQDAPALSLGYQLQVSTAASQSPA
ncbi:CRIB domain-containing protein [Drosera capensis]